jgi:hypothetical protein
MTNPTKPSTSCADMLIHLWKQNAKVDNFPLVGVKSPIHLFTYSPFPFSGNKMQKWTTFLWSELNQLFTYSPIHFFNFTLSLGDLGDWNQNGAEIPTSTRIGRMRLKQQLTNINSMHWGICSIRLEINSKN